MGRIRPRMAVVPAAVAELPMPRALDWYKPSPTQAAFHQSTTYYNLVTGGGRAGKTSSCLADLAWDLLGRHPFRPWCGPFTALIFAVSRQQSAMVAQKKLLEECQLPGDAVREDGSTVPLAGLPFIPPEEIADIGSVKIGFRSVQWVKFKNGCELFFSWSDTNDTWKRIQGPKIGAIYIDENAGSKKLLIEARKRLVDSQHPGTWHGRLTWGAHGTEINDAFDDFRARCEDPNDHDHALHILRPGETGAVDQAAIDRFAATLSEEERRIHITGEATSSGLVQIYGKQWSPSRHVIPAAEGDDIRDDDNLGIAYDPGVDHPMGMVAFRMRRDQPQRLTAIREWFRKGGTIEEDARAIAQFLRGRRLAWFVYDTNLKNRDRGGGPSVLHQLKDRLAEHGVMPFGWWQSKKNHAPGIALVRGMLDPLPGDPTVPPLIQVSEACGTLISQIVRYRGKEETRFTGEGGIVKKYDELCDDLRYAAMGRFSWRPEYACGAPTRPEEGVSAESTATPEAVALTPEQALWHERLAMSAAAAQRRTQRRSVVRVVPF